MITELKKLLLIAETSFKGSFMFYFLTWNHRLFIEILKGTRVDVLNELDTLSFYYFCGVWVPLLLSIIMPMVLDLIGTTRFFLFKKTKSWLKMQEDEYNKAIETSVKNSMSSDKFIEMLESIISDTNSNFSTLYYHAFKTIDFNQYNKIKNSINYNNVDKEYLNKVAVNYNSRLSVLREKCKVDIRNLIEINPDFKP